MSTGRRHPQRTVRQRPNYRESDSDCSEVAQGSSQVTRLRRKAHRCQFYLEESSTSSEASEREHPTVPSSHGDEKRRFPIHVQLPGRARTQLAIRKRVRGPKGDGRNTSFDNLKRRKTSKAEPVKIMEEKGRQTSSEICNIANTSVPPWQILEYQILVNIFGYAAWPLSPSGNGPSSIQWLLEMSTLCKSFREGALAVLLWSPPLLPATRAHRLLSLLRHDQSTLSSNYRAKIHALDIEAKHLLIRKSGVDLDAFLQYTPLVRHLRIYHWYDEMIGKAIWATPSHSSDKWSYGSLFQTLDDYQIRLRSFEWNGRFQDTLSALLPAHARPCLRYLTHVAFVNLNFEERQEQLRAKSREDVFEVINMLPHLQSIQFSNTNIVDCQSTARIPPGLSRLAMMNCSSLTSEALQLSLVQTGASLTELNLTGNQAMDLGFMPDLATLCPILRNLSIDLTYDDPSSYRDRDPLYDDLLPNGTPSWPQSLRSIAIGPLRCLEGSEAEDFYLSLIDAAADLPYLRTLKIKTLLGAASWRDRARMRSKWETLFSAVFQQESSPQYLSADQPKDTPAKGRKSARIHELEKTQSASLEPRTDLVLGPHHRPVRRQNRCEVVEFELSDQRPAQEQFRETDFLDSEASGDEEWNGRDEVVARSSYAW